MGHVAAILGDCLVVHGGRTSPDQALADVWAIRLPSSGSAPMTWTRFDASDDQPSGRHRHSAVLVESSAEVSSSHCRFSGSAAAAFKMYA